jgi:carbamoyl-phosphate synthase large subunit
MELGFHVVATEGTRKALKEHGLDVELVLKLHEGRPHVLDSIKNQKDSANYQHTFWGRSTSRWAFDSSFSFGLQNPDITTIAGCKGNSRRNSFIAVATDGCEGVARLHPEG